MSLRVIEGDQSVIIFKSLTLERGTKQDGDKRRK